VWTQQGPKLIGTGANFVCGIGIFQGYSVALSADGNTALACRPTLPSAASARHGSYLGSVRRTGEEDDRMI
jgi:hypothetical protein